MPEANTNGAGGFDLSSLSSVLQNEDTMRQLRQMADSMGLGAQLEGALNQMQSGSAPADTSANHPGNSLSDGHTQNENGQGSVNIPVSGAGQPSVNHMNNGNGSGRNNNGYNNNYTYNQQNNGRSNRNNGNNSFIPNHNGGNGNTEGNNYNLPAGLNSLLSNPTALAQLGRVMQAMNNRGPEYAFLNSLKPLLRPEKAPKVDQALQIMQMMQALQMVGGNNGTGLSGLMGLPGLLGLK